MVDKTEPTTLTRLWRVLIAAMLVIGGALVLPFASNVASAHHPEISGSLNCSSGLVSFNAVSWKTDGSDGSGNAAIQIAYQADGEGPFIPVTTQPFAAPTYGFSGSFPYPAGAGYIEVRATAIGLWDNGAEPGDWRDFTITYTSSCPPQSPTVDLTVTCVNVTGATGDGQAVVTLKNPNLNTSATFVLWSPSGVDETIVVGAGGTATRTFGPLADGSYSISYSVNGGEKVQKNFTIDCDRPGTPVVLNSVECINKDGAVTVTMANTGGEPITFQIRKQGDASFESIVVAPGGTAARTYSGYTDGSHTVEVRVGDANFDQTFTVDCDDKPGTPKVTVSDVCADEDGTVSVLLENIGGQLPLTFIVNGTPHTVAANDSKTVTISGLSDGNHTITITQGQQDFSKTVDVNCDKAPTVTYVEKCTTGGETSDGQVVITLHNNGDDKDATFTINGGSVITVGPKDSKEVTVGPLADGPHTITITINGKTADSIVVDTDCDHPGTPSASATVECSEFDGVATVHLTNTGGETALTFTVNGNPVVVDGNSSKDVTVSGLGDGQVKIPVFVGDTDLSVTVTVTCNPVVNLTAICDEAGVGDAPGTYWYSVTNTEDEAITVTWADGSVTIPAKATVTIKSNQDTIALSFGQEQIATSDAKGERCQSEVDVTKTVQGPAPTGEVYTIRISRLVGDSYVTVATIDLKAGETTKLMLPSTLDPSGVEYIVEEIASGTSALQTVKPDSFTLTGNLGETVSVVVTNSYAAVEIDKSVDLAEVEAGQNLAYTLVGHNAGALPLHDVVVIDQLPSQVTFVSASVAGNAGVCAAGATKPQVVACSLDGTLAVNGTTPVITVIVKVDVGTPADTKLVNQAKIVGFFADDEGGDVPTAPSCLPSPSGSVCDLSPAVSSTVTQRGSGGPTTTTTTPGATTTTVRTGSSGGQLPSTGADVSNLLTVAVMLLGVGGLFMVLRRRGSTAG